MKRILSIVLVLALVLAGTAMVFAETLEDSGLVPWATAEFKDGKAGSFASPGALLFEKDGKVTLLGKDYKTPTGLAVDEKGDLYISETGKNRICKISLKGVSSEFKKGLTEPTDLCFSDGVLYVAETGKNRIVKIEKSKIVPVAGNGTKVVTTGVYEGGFVNGLAEVAEFDHPQGVAVAEDGAVYVSDTNNHCIRVIKDGRVYTFWADDELNGSLVKPASLTIKDNTLYVHDLFSDETYSKSLEAERYSDVPETEWFYESVMEGTLRRLVNGFGDGTFHPNDTITRAQFLRILSSASLYKDGTEVISGDSVFTDVTDKDWYKGVVNWAAAKGIVSAEDGLFGEHELNREEMMVLLYEYAKAMGLDTSKTADLSVFTDADEISEDALNAVSWAVGSGIVEGMGNNLMMPKYPANRAMALQVVVGYMD